MLPPALGAALEDAAGRLRAAPKDEPVLLVSHMDADGIAACAILATALRRLGQRHEVRCLLQLTADEVERLRERPLVVFLDLGSSHAALIKERMSAIIVDHHQTSGEGGEIEALNPVLHGLDGSRDACSATIALLLAQQIDEKNADLAPLALVGIIADAQEKLGLSGLNADVVDAARAHGIVSVEERLRLFGYERRGLVGMLIASHDLRIPGVTGNPHGARRFLEAVGIPARNRYGREMRFNDLSEDQRQRLFEAGKKAATKQPATATHFVLPRERGMFRDARQYATLLNACGRLEQPLLGIAMCLGEEEARMRCAQLLDEYQAALRSAYEWQKHEDQRVTRAHGYVIIDARRDILPSLIGTVCSMIARGGDVAKGTFVLGLARYGDGLETKVSMRVAGYEKSDLNGMVSRMMAGVHGESGGHAQAAGAIIKTEDEPIFLENAKKVLEEAAARQQ